MRSFLNYLLPDDEYKRTRILYFLAESAVILAVGLLIFTGLNSYWFEIGDFNLTFTLFLIYIFIIFYVYLRYIFSGIEFTSVYNKKQYKRERQLRVKTAFSSGVVFFLVNFFLKGIPTNLEEWLDIVGPSVLFIVFFILFDFISLKRSFKKNKELMDD